MAFVSTLHHELASQPLKPEPAVSINPFSPPVWTSPQLSSDNIPENTVQEALRDEILTTQPEPQSQPAQQVFEQAPLPETNRPRQLAVTTLIVLSNLVQVCRYLYI
jgi:hypothetical protein